jgi:hypothetical protein
VKQFKRAGDGSIVGSFNSHERGLLKRLASQLDELLEIRTDDAAAADDPALDRLFPDAYADDAEAAAEFRRFTESDLIERKQHNAGVIVSTLSADQRGALRLSESEAQAWLRSLTDLRLTFAARLGIQNDGDELRLGLAQLPLRQIYGWLGLVQESLVRAVDS